MLPPKSAISPHRRLCLLYLLLTYLLFKVSADSLELIQIVYRHGDRSPTNPMVRDPNNQYWMEVTDGYGQLTNTGKQQHYALGQYFRQRYATFLNASYGHREVTINSTDKDRTLMSAYSDLAGLYPPTGSQVWESNLSWQPIPVHTRPLLTDYVIGTDSYCPKYDNLFDAVKQSPEMQQINQENADLFALASSETGRPVNDIFDLNEITDFYFCCKCHDLSTPDWIEPVWDRMLALHDLKFYYEFGVPPLARLIGGPLVGDMIQHMKLKVDGTIPLQKAYFYSSHDSKIAAFLSALQVFNNKTPPYASSVMVELYSLDQGGHGVQIWYRNDSTVDPYPITIPNCTATCPLDEFIELTASMIPSDVTQECILVENRYLDIIPSSLNGLWSWFENIFH